MEEVIIAVCPYRAEVLRACNHAVSVEIAKIILVGKKSKIVETCFMCKIPIEKFEIINCDNDIDVCFVTNDLIKERKVVGLIIGNFSETFVKNFGVSDYEINVIDVPFSRHLLFVANYIKDSYIGYEEKASAIICAKKIMQNLNIAYYNIGLVTGKKTKVNEIEKNVIKMNEDLNKCDIDVVNVSQVFGKSHNLLVFNDIDSSNIFLDSLLTHENSKYANLKLASNAFIVDASKMKLKDVFFSLFLINKMCLNTE